MKRKSIIALVLGCLGLGALTTSCEDMLSPDSERHSYTVAQDTLYSYWGILRSLQNIGERYVVLGECRGDLVDGTTYLSDSINTILNFDMDHATDGSCRYLQASDYYHVVNSCNAYMAKCDTLRTTGTLKPYMMKEFAQVSAIRAWVYLQLVQVYGEVPFYTTPLLTTKDINDFMSNPSHQTATADNLADLLAPQLEQMYTIEQEYGFPQYEEYGKENLVCNAQKCMIPVSLILGDLYLTKGDKQSCEKAAQWYYNYFSPKNFQNAGGTLPRGYYSYGYQGEGMDKPVYVHDGTPWTEKGAWSKNTEAITAIPSSTNKLWGTVQRGVNELFGFASEIRVSSGGENDSVTHAGVSLTPQYDVKQLRASEGYFAQCKAVPFEYYVAASSDAVSGSDNTLELDTIVGDARRSWVQEFYQSYGNGVTNKEYFVTKQNPGGAFTTVYPMIYRKSMVWLRYAEALNRAGYPSYAFAILKNGLCNNDTWLPEPEEHYAVKDTLYTSIVCNVKWEDGTTEEVKYEPEIEIKHLAVLEENAVKYIQKLEAEKGMTADDISTLASSYEALSYMDYPDPTLASKVICDYISRQERLNSEGVDFLNFKNNNMYATSASSQVMYRISNTSRNVSMMSYSSPTSGTYITTGIHYHGAGLLKYDEKRSVFNYVEKIIAIAKQNYGKTLTIDDIYDEANLDIVQDCVEDMIVDEEAMELAFEGTRFFDLMRVAHRRGDASYLAERVSKRTGVKDASLYSKLLSTKNWYFPLPQK